MTGPGGAASRTRLPARAWPVLAGDAVSAFGTGLTLPFLVVYLHRVRGIDLTLTGPIFSVIAVLGLVGNPVGGLLSDRIGARRTAVAGLLVVGAGTAGFAAVHTAWQGFAAAACYGLGISVTAPAFQALLGASVPVEGRPKAFAIRQVGVNVGAGLGGVAAASVASFTDPGTFVLLYLLDSATFLVFAVVIALTARDAKSAGTGFGGYRTVLADRRMVGLWGIVVVLVACGYGQLFGAYPIYAADRAGLDAGELRLTFVAHTVTVVAAQFFVLRLMAARRRTRGLAVCAALMALAWLIVPGTGSVLWLTLALVVFALGETFLAPTAPAIVNDLATDSDRGRYNGVYTLAWTTGYVIGPGTAGLMLSAGLGDALFVGSALALCAAAALAFRLERILPEAANRSQRKD
ncbi:MFS transporter [Actinocorallia sp. A-T 12471]|uniref:MFS transporter n=1 Tax=Actinocorallia sp. A-T 12471 TaxID=3089813 RepID=UPI0029CBC3A7|nr:MFS transporter [Actinocorallia sp. A-T 12471]MDX6742662.1 MFS transporter [Actinocorallia sp. A-T 12471]